MASLRPNSKLKKLTSSEFHHCLRTCFGVSRNDFFIIRVMIDGSLCVSLMLSRLIIPLFLEVLSYFYDEAGRGLSVNSFILLMVVAILD